MEGGFHTVEKPVLELLTEMFQASLFEFGRSTRMFTELAGRVEPTVGDVTMALIDMGVQSGPSWAAKLLKETYETNDPSTTNSAFAKGSYNFISGEEESTAAQPITDYAACREKTSQQKRDLEKSLSKFFARTSSCYYLFPENKSLFPLISPKPASYLDPLIPQDQIFEEEQISAPLNFVKKEKAMEHVPKLNDDDEDGDDVMTSAQITTTSWELIDNPFLKPTIPRMNPKGQKSKLLAMGVCAGVQYLKLAYVIKEYNPSLEFDEASSSTDNYWKNSKGSQTVKFRKMATAKLYYFDARGVGEPIRLILTYGGVEFEDIRAPMSLPPTIPPEIKQKCTWGTVPVIEFEGKKLAQSLAMTRYFAKRFKLVPQDDYEAALCDEYVDASRDLYNAIKLEDPQEREKAIEEAYTTTKKRFMDVYEAALKQSPTGKYFVGNSMTGRYLRGCGCTWGQVPLVEFDGKKLTQSLAITRYFAKKFGLVPTKDDFQAALCDEYVDASRDFMTAWTPVVVLVARNEEAGLQEKKDEVYATTKQRFLTVFNTIVEQNGGKHLVGNSLTWADIYVTHALQNIEMITRVSLVREFPALKTLMDEVLNVPSIKSWVETRPKTRL
ncbi:Transcription initiation factor TFIID subunit 8 [Orchesella cincta]|uniref:glutathione transferase n=1 Tax=Orchesella cincta TaxID=48709 RepID=A0A1D2MUK8_ORCCI|nr:Transcription initiation factor TFIID subunit 8 [Orchesella cincta]